MTREQGGPQVSPGLVTEILLLLVSGPSAQRVFFLGTYQFLPVVF